MKTSVNSQNCGGQTARRHFPFPRKDDEADRDRPIPQVIDSRTRAPDKLVERLGDLVADGIAGRASLPA